MDLSDKFYLKPNVVLEPLFDRWYAWSHLISPATAAKNITGRHLKIMKSYIQAPQVHLAASKNPKMRGGPFIGFRNNRVDEIKELQDKTKSEQEELIEFSDALSDLDEMLAEKANGYSLEELYDEIPEILRGYVELVYDLNNQPSYRFYEALLYNSDIYKTSSQSINLWITNNDERDFVLSTPRVKEDHIVHLNIPFDHEFIDEFSKMKRTPQSLGYLKNMICVDNVNEQLFDSFFTKDPPPAYVKYDGEQVRIRYFGHACILVETKDISILIDPIVSYYGYQNGVDRFSDINLPDQIDYVLITHNHQDHILFETLLPLRHKIKHLIVPRTTCGALQDPNLKLMFKNIGFDNVIEIGEMENVTFKDCTITGLPFIGEHCDLNIQSKICYHVKVGDFSMLFFADSCIIEPKLYEHIHKSIGDVDVIFLGMECEGAPTSWLYGPLYNEPLSRDMDYSRRLAGSNYDQGKSLVDIFNPNEVYVYAMGQEPWLEFISSIKYTPESHPIVQSNMLIDHVLEQNKVAERLFGEKEILYNKVYAQ
jgi:L-ascorbate metabolism protein UlaG (beta-lactamase superfamily)